MLYAYIALALIFWRPIAMTGLMFYHKVIKKDDTSFSKYYGDMKAWFLSLYDLIKVSKVS